MTKIKAIFMIGRSS